MGAVAPEVGVVLSPPPPETRSRAPVAARPEKCAPLTRRAPVEGWETVMESPGWSGATPWDERITVLTLLVTA